MVPLEIIPPRSKPKIEPHYLLSTLNIPTKIEVKILVPHGFTALYMVVW
jgi:hypothetical protein